MKFYDASRPLYMETDASRVGLVAGLLQVREGMNCGFQKMSLHAQLHLPAKDYHVQSGNTAMGSPWNTTLSRKISPSLFAKEVCVITDHKPFVAMISEGVAMLFQWLQHIMLCIYHNIV